MRKFMAYGMRFHGGEPGQPIQGKLVEIGDVYLDTGSIVAVGPDHDGIRAVRLLGGAQYNLASADIVPLCEMDA